MLSQSWDLTEHYFIYSLDPFNWTYQMEQIGAGRYVLQGVDNRGHQVDSVGTDSELLEEGFFEAA